MLEGMPEPLKWAAGVFVFLGIIYATFGAASKLGERDYQFIKGEGDAVWRLDTHKGYLYRCGKMEKAKPDDVQEYRCWEVKDARR